MNVLGAAVGGLAGGSVGGPVGGMVGFGVGGALGMVAEVKGMGVAGMIERQNSRRQQGVLVPRIGSRRASRRIRRASRRTRRPPPRHERLVVLGSFAESEPVQGPPLGVSRVQLAPDAVELRGGVTFFAIDVWPDSGSPPWRVHRRYNEFRELAIGLGGRGQHMAPFPGKTLSRCEGARLEARRRELERWLRGVVDHPSLQSFGWGAPLGVFLGSITPASAPLPLATPPAPPPPSAPPASPATEASKEHPDPVLLEVTVPQGIAPGQPLYVALPDGRQVLIAVPSGAVAGQPLELWLDQDTGTLSVLTA